MIFVDQDVTATDEFVFFWRGWPSQWVRSPFVVDGASYNCCEQYMMAEKARVFGDAEFLGKILRTVSPKAQKSLGREVRGFDEKVWNSVCRGIVYSGNLARFQQNADLAEKLLATGSRTIVEASPVDRVWGIGLAVDNPDVHVPAKWQGKNWLGVALMQVRAELRGEARDAELRTQLEARQQLTRSSNGKGSS
ncbi:MAG TPA: NADAR family protein [Phycisphaerae bacterium]|nr:NADAR family protein [Phycisphaerae bacterium]